MAEILTYCIQKDDDEFIVVHLEHPIICDDENGLPHIKKWGTEKTALQWLRRNAQNDRAKYEVFKVDGTPLYMDYAIDPVFRLGKHNWQKVNVMALADARGPYDKLVCEYCKKIVRRYRGQRHFREELETCEKNMIPVETT